MIKIYVFGSKSQFLGLCIKKCFQNYKKVGKNETIGPKMFFLYQIANLPIFRPISENNGSMQFCKENSICKILLVKYLFVIHFLYSQLQNPGRPKVDHFLGSNRPKSLLFFFFLKKVDYFLSKISPSWAQKLRFL